MKKVKINDNRIRNLTISVIALAIVIIIFVIFAKKVIKDKVSKDIITVSSPISEQIEWFEDEESENLLDINEIIKENIGEEVKEVIETQSVELEYETQYKNNGILPKGIIQVLQQGEDGQQELIIKKQYSGEKLISDKQIGRKVIKASIDRIVEVGTSKNYSNHKIKNGDTVYATPYELAVRKEAKKGSEIIIKINQNSKLKIEKKKENWYYIKYNSYYGWVESDCITDIIPDSIIKNSGNNKTYSKKELLATLSKNMKLNKASGFTLEQFEKIFKGEDKDKRAIFAENAKYFYYIEQAYGINGVFVASIAIHESNWGTSKIAINKNNLFGYGAYDRSAYLSAYSYNNYSEGIDMIARVLIKHYLNPKGNSIYNGETATGKYYNGNSLLAVNKKYATDKNWSNSIYKWMKYLYNRL